MPTLYIIAGPNGIGKTTSFYDLVPSGTPVINSDEIAREVRDAGLLSVNAQEHSNQEAIRLMEEHRLQRNSFAIETNLADVNTWKFLLEVQKTGYQLHVLYMSTDHLSLLNGRIAERVRLGDHFVRPDIVEERYIAGLKLLNHYFKVPDRLQLLDNSKTPTLVLEANYGKIVEKKESLPRWIINNFYEHLDQNQKPSQAADLKTIDDARKLYEQMREKSSSIKSQKNDDTARNKGHKL